MGVGSTGLDRLRCDTVRTILRRTQRMYTVLVCLLAGLHDDSSYSHRYFLERVRTCVENRLEAPHSPVTPPGWLGWWKRGVLRQRWHVVAVGSWDMRQTLGPGGAGPLLVEGG